ncbi:MAG TPA: AAA family ATPase [Solirubrobacteraceae bacterium]
MARAVAARLDAEVVAVHDFPGAGSPVTAARHAGSEIDPGALVARIRAARPAVVVAPGGPLAPLTPRYSNRDLARELGFPVLLAVPATPELVGVARLAVEAIRGAGLRLAAVALTGWPSPPDRVLLDERRLLTDLVVAPVVTFPDASAWPVGAWLSRSAPPAAAPAPAAPAPVRAPMPALVPAPAPPARAVLEPYRAWAPRPAGDPRGTPRPQIMAAILEIVAAEGPMLASRAYALYNKAAGGKKLTTIARAPLSSAVYWLAQERKVLLTKADEIPWQGEDMVRLPDAPAVHVRELGPRTLEEVPLDEIAELMRRQRAGDGAAAKRAVLEAYGLKRLTTRADAYLELAVGLAAG